MNNCKIIAIANQKGGVDKTTTTMNLGVGLAREGKRVLLVDGDPQDSLTIAMGIPNPDAQKGHWKRHAGKSKRPGYIHHSPQKRYSSAPHQHRIIQREMSLYRAISSEILKSYHLIQRPKAAATRQLRAHEFIWHYLAQYLVSSYGLDVVYDKGYFPYDMIIIFLSMSF